MRALLSDVCIARNDHQEMTKFFAPNLPSGFKRARNPSESGEVHACHIHLDLGHIDQNTTLL